MFIDNVEKKKQDILDKLNPQQQIVAKNYKGASFTLAVPGSGKSHTLVARTQYMILDGVSPKNILMFTFTKKAAEGMRTKVKKVVGDTAGKIMIKTYHSFCVQMLKQYVDDYLPGYTHHFSVFDTQDRADILKPIAKNSGLDFKEFDNIISYWKDNLIDPQTAMAAAQENDSESVEFYVAAAKGYSKYVKTMRSLNAMDFDDLLYYFIRIMEEHESVRVAMRRRFHYIMNDEAQDSNETNLRLIELIANPDTFNVCCVGDIDQSIYAFRGSDIPSVHNFIRRHNMTIYELGENYRSTQNIFNAARSVICHNGTLFQQKPFTQNEIGEKIVSFTAKSAADEAMRVTKIMSALHNKKNITLNEMAVLYRMSFQSRVMEEFFLKNGIKYTITGGVPFYGRKEVKDILAYVRVLNNPRDRVAFERAITTPKCGIGQVTINKITTELEEIFKKDDITSCIASQESSIIRVIRGLKTYSATQLKGKAQTGFNRFLQVLEAAATVIEEDKPNKLLEFIIKETNYEEYIREFCEKNKKDKENAGAEERLQNIDELIELSSAFDSIDEFLQNMLLTSELSALNEECSEEKDDRVHLMTMHAAKGLEFDVVALIGIYESCCPHYRATTSEEVEEERRLFYVAMTRAKKILCISWPAKTVMNGLATITIPSRFFKEIEPQYLMQKK